jgi:Carboxypeptidase regulatory-like domain
VKLRRLMALVMSIALTSTSYPFVSVAAQAPNQVTGLNISGTVIRSDRTTVANACLRLRNVDTNVIVARTVSDGSGAFSFSASEPGTYLVEAVDCGNGGVLAVSDALNLAALPLKTVVVLPDEVKEAFYSSTAFLVLAAASAAGITVFAIKSGASTPAVSSPEQ